MSHSGFTSGEELLRVRNRDQTLLPSSEKVDEAVGSWMEEKMVESRLQEHHTLLEEPKIARKDQLATGQWLPESQMVKLTRPGKFWHHMGVETDIGKCLYPEEAVFLIDTGELEVVYDSLPLSLQQAQTVLLQDGHHLDQYLVYSHLARTGCKVVRHQPHLIFTKYEKDIRIDQHQISRKGTKLKLGSTKTSHTDDSTQSASQSKPVDAALEELYACLGDAAVNPLTLDKDGASSSVSAVTSNSKDKEKETGKKISSSEEKLSLHQIKRREMIDMFPSMKGSEVTCVDIEPVDLLPNNAIPSKKSYEISTEALEYYSVYETRHHYHYENQGHRNWNRNESWNQSRNDRWNSRGNDSNWQARDDSYQSYGYRDRERDRDNRWQQSRPQRDAHAMWREERNGRWGSANDSNWRHHNNPDHDRRFRDRYGDSEHGMGSRDRYGGSDYDVGFRDRHSNSPQPQDKDQIDYSVWPEWKRKRRQKYRQQGRDSYPSVIVKLRKKVTSWKEYKSAVAEMNAKKQLSEGSTRALWEGRTTPLLTPSTTFSSSVSITSTLLSCSLDAGITDVNAFRNVIPPEAQMKVLYDVYLPTVTYKKSNPPSPNKRIVVMRDSNMPTPGQILEVTSRFVDDVSIVCAVVTGGEVRLYTFTPTTLPPPTLSLS